MSEWGGVNTVKADPIRLYASSFSGFGGNVSYSDGKLQWKGTGDNVATAITVEAGAVAKFSKIKFTCSGLTEGASYRVMITTSSSDNYISEINTTGDVTVYFSDLTKQWGSEHPTSEVLATVTSVRIGGGTGGSPTADSPYELTINPTSFYIESEDEVLSIASTADWTLFSKMVASGVSPLNAQLTADVNAGITMVGTSSNPYTGTFDGAGHTLTFNYDSSTSNEIAPFQYINNATISNLTTTGSINAQNIFGGIVGTAGGESTLNYCTSSMTLTANDNGDSNNGRVAGLVGRCADNATPVGTSITFNNCIFDGSISSTQGSRCCGLVSWARSTSVIANNCLIAPTSVTNGAENIAATGGTDPEVTPTNCYYTTKFGYSSQGTAATAVETASGALCYKLNGNAVPSTSYFFGQDLKAVSSSPLLTDNVAYKVFDLGGGEYANWTNTISNNADWVTFSKLVANGTTSLNVTMTADVDAGSTMVGAENGKEYSGTFDGAGHTLTFNYEGSSNMVAPFKAVNGATIKDLITTGSILSSNNLLAGIIGQNNGATSLIRCASHMSVTTTVGDNGRIGGLVARNANTGSSLTFTNCMYDGAISSSTNQAAGFVGWSPNATTISNCLVASTSITGGESNFAPNLCTIPDGKYALYINKFGSSTQGTKPTDAQLYNGYVAYTLNSDISDGVLFFGQGKLNSSVVELPSMTSVASKKVLKMNDDNGYANPGGLLPDPASKNKLSWKFENSGEAPYQTTLPAEQTTDKTIYGSPDAYNLVIGSAQFSTFVFPYDVAELPTGVKAYNLTFDGTAVKASEVLSITADEPVLINAEPGTYRFNSGLAWWQSVDFSAHTSTTNGALTGVYNTSMPFSYVPVGAYVLQNGEEGLGFYQVTAEDPIKITSFRAYLTAETPARSLSIVFADETTGISEVSVVKDKNYFNLGGQRVSKPAKGLYIMNGKKVMIK